LVAVCRKAMRKIPGERYPTAQAFADDLRRWLRGEPTEAHPWRGLRRPWFWARRNVGWATTLVLAAGAAVGSLVLWGLLANQARLTAEARADGAAARADAADDRARASERQVLIQNLQRLRTSAHKNGWSTEGLTRVRQLRQAGAGKELNSDAAALLSGLDARIEKTFDKLGGTAVAFDSTGQRILIGAVTAEHNSGRPGEGAKVWDRQLDRQLHVSSQARDGPVAFRPDGTPLQLFANPKDRHAVVLWDVAHDQPVREFRIATGAPPEPLTPGNHPELVLSSDGAAVSAAFPRPDETASVAVWDAASGDVIFQTVDKATTLALAPDRTLLAQGDADGRIVLRSLPKGEPLTTMKADRAAITCLALQRDRRRTSDQPSPVSGWLLAAGDEGGTVTVWDCEARVQRSVCRGSNFQMHSVAFSPDGVTLASTARTFVKLWDVATGRPLLDLHSVNFMTGAAFSPDGKLVASCAVAALGSPGEVKIWQLEPDRGIRTFRGWVGPITKLDFSPNEQFLTALFQDGRLAVWDLKTGLLRHNFEAPKVAWVDNAAIAISPDNRQLAFAGSTQTRGQAVLWDLDTGKVAGNWSFAPGLQNILAFHPSGKLLLFQVETKDGKRLPDAGNDRRVNPPVLRVRDLRADPDKAIHEIAEFNRHIASLHAAEDGNVIALVGHSGQDKAASRKVKAFDGLTGKEVWSSQAETHNLKPNSRCGSIEAVVT
jgi:WD40 repeat protein